MLELSKKFLASINAGDQKERFIFTNENLWRSGNRQTLENRTKSEEYLKNYKALCYVLCIVLKKSPLNETSFLLCLLKIIFFGK